MKAASVIATPNKRARSTVWTRLIHNRSAIIGFTIIVIFALSAIFANVLTPYDYAEQDLTRILESPSADHLLGTDDVGRDVLTRILYGGRVSMTIGLISVTIGLLIGGTLGAVAGFYKGKLDSVIMSIMDMMQAIPSTLLALVIASTLGPGIVNLMIAMGISSIPSYARLVRAATLSIGDQEYIEAARLTGCSDARIILTHIFPNCMATIIVNATLRMAYAILGAASLSFLGLGVKPPMPEWGSMLSSARQFMTMHPHLIIFPGIAIALVILGFNLMGDGLRDALDPRLKN